MPTTSPTTPALPPETVEGWYALHQLFAVDQAALRRLPVDERARALGSATATLGALRVPAEGGWSLVAPLVGSEAEVLIVHLRPTLDDLEAAQASVRRLRLHEVLRPVYTFLSVTEAGLYHITAELAREATQRGGVAGDEKYRTALAQRVEAERATPHVQRRLYPEPPPEMPYVCFYPMSKRRTPEQNWYALSLEERSRLMHTHGTTGRRYAGKVLQVITGAIGLDAWEWGVTLFAADPLEFKRLVTEMRFDEVSAQYAEFGDFYVGKVSTAEQWVRALEG